MQIKKESKHSDVIFIGMFFMYLIGMVPGFLLGDLFLSKEAILPMGMFSRVVIGFMFVRITHAIDLAIFGEVTNDPVTKDSGEQ